MTLLCQCKLLCPPTAARSIQMGDALGRALASAIEIAPGQLRGTNSAHMVYYFTFIALLERFPILMPPLSVL